MDLASMLGIKTPADLNPLGKIRRLSGYAVWPYPIVLEGDKPMAKFVWQLGPLAPQKGDMVLLGQENGKVWKVAGMVPAEMVEKYDIRVGDSVEGMSFGTTQMQLSADGPKVDVPMLAAQAALAGQVLDQPGLQLNINDRPPAPRPYWRYVNAEYVRYPHEAFELGHDPSMIGVQIMRLFGEIGRGGKILLPSGAGGGKTRLMFEILTAIARYGSGRRGLRYILPMADIPLLRMDQDEPRPVKVVLGLIGERPEDYGENWPAFRDAIQESELVVEMELIMADTDYALDPLTLLQVAQLAVARAQRLAELSAALPVEQRYDVIVACDSGKRIMDAMDRMSLGDKALPGGRDPYSALLVQMLLQTGRNQMIPDPHGVEDYVALTAIFTMLLGSDRRSASQLDDATGDITFINPLRAPADNGTPLPQMPDYEHTLLRYEDKLEPPWKRQAIHRLMKRLTDRKAKHRDWVQGQLAANNALAERLVEPDGSPNPESRGLAYPALKRLVPDIQLPVEVENARQLVEQDAVTPDEMSSIDQLVNMLVVPTSWGPKIWQNLADEGLVEPLDYLEAKELARESRFEKPLDIVHAIRDCDQRRARVIWDKLAAVDLVQCLEWIAQDLVEAGDAPTDAKSLAGLLGIDDFRAEEVWAWLVANNLLATIEDTSASSPVSKPNPDPVKSASRVEIDYNELLKLVKANLDRVKTLMRTYGGIRAITKFAEEEGFDVKSSVAKRIGRNVKALLATT